MYSTSFCYLGLYTLNSSVSRFGYRRLLNAENVYVILKGREGGVRIPILRVKCFIFLATPLCTEYLTGPRQYWSRWLFFFFVGRGRDLVYTLRIATRATRVYVDPHHKWGHKL